MNTWDEFLDQLRLWGGQNLSVTSWWRSPQRNKAVGGVANSKHLIGEAIDIVWDGAPPLADKLQALLLEEGVKLVREKDHDHFEVLGSVYVGSV